MLETLRAAYEDRYAEARKRKAAGQKVVGYFLNSIPEEVILAAGMFPVRLAGDPADLTELSERYMEEYFDGELRALFGALLAGKFDFLDLLIVPRNSEGYLQLYYLLLEIPEWEPKLRIPPLYLFDLLQTPSFIVSRYVEGRLHALADKLQSLGGRKVDDVELAAGIRAVNTSRRLLSEASALWQGATPRLSGSDALVVIGSASALSREQHDTALRALLAAPPAPLPARGRRVLIKGSPQSDLRFTTLVEGSGGAVVAHDHLWGDRTYDTLVDEALDPWAALAHHYNRNIPSPREYPQAQADARMLELAKRAGVEGVIFFHDEWDDTLGWEYPDQKTLLERNGIATLFLKRQPYFNPPEAAQRKAVSDFVRSVT